MTRPLANRRALVTGASTGIGADFARELAARGSDLVLVARGEARMRELAAELTKAHGIDVKVVGLDLTSPGAARQLFERVQALGVTVDILVNNAGFGLYGAFADQDPGKLREMLELNVVVLTEITRLFLPGMRERGFGRVAQVGSIGSYISGPQYAAYSASKAYVLSLGQALNEELRGTGVSCTVVCPGMTATNFFDAAGHTENSLYKRLVIMTSRDVARIGIDATLKGKGSVVTGWVNKLQTFAQRFLPFRAVYAIAKLTMKL